MKWVASTFLLVLILTSGMDAQDSQPGCPYGLDGDFGITGESEDEGRAAPAPRLGDEGDKILAKES